MDFNKFGFNSEEWSEIQMIFDKIPEIEEVLLFGSRAKNTFKPASDVDIAVIGKDVSSDTILKLIGEFDESTIPYFFDILDHKNISTPELKEHIKQFGVQIYKKLPA